MFKPRLNNRECRDVLAKPANKLASRRLSCCSLRPKVDAHSSRLIGQRAARPYNISPAAITGNKKAAAFSG
jgi:hypothetical protein